VPDVAVIQLGRDMSQVARGREFAADAARKAGFGDDRVFDIMVVSSEAIANAIEHAAVTGEVEVRTAVHGDRLEIHVQSPGEFRTPDQRPDRGSRGLGLPLMAKLSDHVALCSPGNAATLVTLTFYRPGCG
jgi:anti-sigma regulatory factor (Ser/Thr protein kinase)